MTLDCQQRILIKELFLDLLQKLSNYYEFNNRWELRRAELNQLDSIYQQDLQNSSIEKILDAYLEGKERLELSRGSVIGRRKSLDGGRGSGNFEHAGQGDGKVEGSVFSNSVDLSLIDDGLAEIGIKKGQVVDVFGLRKVILLSHLQKRLEQGDNWRSIFKDKRAYEEAKDTLSSLMDEGKSAESDLQIRKLQRAIKRYEFIQALADKIERAGSVSELKRELSGGQKSKNSLEGNQHSLEITQEN